MLVVDYLINAYNENEKIDVKDIVYLNEKTNFFETLSSKNLLNYEKIKNVDFNLLEKNLNLILNFIDNFKKIKELYSKRIDEISKKSEELFKDVNSFQEKLKEEYQKLENEIYKLNLEIINLEEKIDKINLETNKKINEINEKINFTNNFLITFLKNVKITNIIFKNYFEKLFQKNNFDKKFILINGKCENEKFCDNFNFRNNLKISDEINISSDVIFLKYDNYFDTNSYGDDIKNNSLKHSLSYENNELIIGANDYNLKVIYFDCKKTFLIKYDDKLIIENFEKEDIKFLTK